MSSLRTVQERITFLENDFWRMWRLMEQSRDFTENEDGLGTYTFAIMALMMFDLCIISKPGSGFFTADLCRVDNVYSSWRFRTCLELLEPLKDSYEADTQPVTFLEGDDFDCRPQVWGPGTAKRLGVFRKRFELIDGDDGIKRIVFQPDVFMGDMWRARMERL